MFLTAGLWGLDTKKWECEDLENREGINERFCSYGSLEILTEPKTLLRQSYEILTGMAILIFLRRAYVFEQVYVSLITGISSTELTETRFMSQ